MPPGVDSFLKNEKNISHKFEDEAIKRCTQIFKRFDINGDGQISYDELSSVFRAVDPEHWDGNSVRRLLKAIDTSQDGVIRYEELLEWIMGKDKKWDDARQSVLLKGRHCFSPGDVVFVNRDANEAREPFDVEVDLTSGAKCGFVLDSPDGNNLLIKQIKEAGLLAEWNAEHNDQEVHVGDRIVEIVAMIYENRYKKGSKEPYVQKYTAKNDPHDMVMLLKKKAVIKLTIVPSDAAAAFSVKLADSYEILSTIHEGQTAVVKKAKHRKTGSDFAVKSILKQKMPRASLQAEFESMTQLDHPNVVSLHEVFEDFQYIHLVMHYCAGGEVLEQVLENEHFNERQAARVMQQLFAAVRYLHSRHICHRNINAENMMLEVADVALDRANVKLIDFGKARKVSPNATEKMHTITGAAEYISYEMLSMHGYTMLCDTWSCGIVMFLLLGGYPPFMGSTDTETRKLIKQCNLSFSDRIWDTVSDDAKDFLKMLLSFEATRPAVDDAFQHKWVKDLAPKADDRHLESTYSNIKTFSQNGKMKKLALYALARRLTMEEVEQLRYEFELVDKNKDGSVTFNEFRDTLDKRNDKVAEEMRRVFEAVDVDGNKRIEYTEFLAGAIDRKLSHEEHGLWMAFNVFDHDGSGMISKKELKDILETDEGADLSSTLGATTDSIARCLAECDSDMDGQIDFQEFLSMMRGGAPCPVDSPHHSHKAAMTKTRL